MKWYTRWCVGCDRVFGSTRGDAIYCGPACRQAVYALRRRRRAARLARER